MEHPLTHHQALLITGPQGSGKTTLAREIAARHGTYTEIEAIALKHRDQWKQLIATGAQTVIINDVYDKRTLEHIKQLITMTKDDPIYTCYAPKKGPMPYFIATASSPKFIKTKFENRRFRIVNLDKRGEA